MKLISLNIWGARMREQLLEFILRNKDIDIFCFQEIYHNAAESFAQREIQPTLDIFTKLQEALPNHNSYFRPTVAGTYGIGIFIKKEILVLEEGELVIHENPNFSGRGGDHSRNLEWIVCDIKGVKYSIVNVHGLWNGIGKTDTEDRLEQSRKIKNFLNTLSAPKILCGDFNLRPDTKSIEMFEDEMKNLIKEYNITSTRTRLYDKTEKFADYMFVSPDLEVLDFKVLPDEVSDHAALLLEF
jgi:exonuclease III